MYTGLASKEAQLVQNMAKKHYKLMKHLNKNAAHLDIIPIDKIYGVWN